MELLTVQYEEIKVFYSAELDGGGMKFGQDYVRLLREELGPVHTVYEWCCGPAFIGFSLLAHGCCKELVLSDINPAAIEACQHTIEYNKLGDRVRVYLSDSLKAVPSGEKFDLVVSNPPHSATGELIPEYGAPLIYQDVGWENHRNFYLNIGKHLQHQGRVVIQENAVVSKVEDFLPMIEEGGLTLIKSWPIPNAFRKYYVMSGIA